MVGGKYNVLVHFVNVCATDLAGVVIWNPFTWDFLWIITIKNHIICVPKWILFLKHRNRKVVGGKHNVLVHCVNVCAPDLAGVVIWNSFTWYFFGSLLSKNLVIFVRATTVKWILFLNHMYRKVVGGTHNVLVRYMDISAPNPSGVVVCNPFKWDVLCSFLIKNHVVFCVPATKAKWIWFLNHRNRKFAVGKHNLHILFDHYTSPIVRSKIYIINIWNVCALSAELNSLKCI